MKNIKYYVVWKGYNTGIYYNWDDCKKQVNGFSGGEFKSFDTLDEANKAFEGYSQSSNTDLDFERPTPYSIKSLIVSGNCPNNFGEMSYRWNLSASTNNAKRKQLPIIGTKNIADFLAIVDLIKLSKKVKLNLPIYTDSKIAKNWILNKKCNHQLFASKKTATVLAVIKETEEWLLHNAVGNEIIVWDSVKWGKFPYASRSRNRKLKSN